MLFWAVLANCRAWQGARVWPFLLQSGLFQWIIIAVSSTLDWQCLIAFLLSLFMQPFWLIRWRSAPQPEGIFFLAFHRFYSVILVLF